jgi:hypothetical protein
MEVGLLCEATLLKSTTQSVQLIPSYIQLCSVCVHFWLRRICATEVQQAQWQGVPLAATGGVTHSYR